MEPLKIEFAPDSMVRRLQDVSISAGILLIVLLVFTGGLTARANQLLQGKLRLEDKVQDLQAEIKNLEKKWVKAPVPKLPQEQVLAVNQTIARLNIPWTDLFDALEKSSSDKVALLQVSPNIQKASVQAVAETKNADDMIAYIEALKQQKLFTAVVLEKHEINEQDPNKPYRFQFEAQWHEGGKS